MLALIAGLGREWAVLIYTKASSKGWRELSIVAEALAQTVGHFGDIYATAEGRARRWDCVARHSDRTSSAHYTSPGSCCLGTAILAGVAIGEYESIDQAVATLVEDGTKWSRIRK
jgi:hypothetical protein